MKRIPIVIVIDVEPDDRQIDPSVAKAFVGFEGLFANLAPLRARLASVGAGPHLSWFFRLDPQVAEVYGSASWPLTHYAAEVAALQSAGDAIGIHTHGYRWDAAERGWITDHGDQSWIDRTVREAFDLYHQVLGAPCRIFRFGDHWMNDATVRLLEELGVEIDLSLEPGMPGRLSLVDSERHTGAIPDLTTMPRTPYRPSRDDFRVADPRRTSGLWMMPVTTGRLPAYLRRGRSFYRWLRRAPDAEFEVLALNPGLAPLLFRSLTASILETNPPSCLVLPVRTSIGAPQKLAGLRANIDCLLTHPLRDRFICCTPSEALALVNDAHHAGG